MQALMAQALRACSRTLPVKSLAARVALAAPQRGFLVVPSYKARTAVAFRSYATATATKKTAAAKKPAAKKPATAASKKTTTRKKAVAKKAATKAKPKKTAKKAAAKPKPKPKKKVLTAEEKARADKRQLRIASLIREQPTKLPASSWLIYSTTHVKDKPKGKELGATMKAIAADFKKLSPSEIQRLKEQGTEHHAQNVEMFKKWVESYPVGVIREANKARARLVRVYKTKVHPAKLVDERGPKRPLTPFSLYVRAHKSDFPSGSNTSAAATLKQMSQTWRSLSEAEKKAYIDLAAAERLRYQEELAQI